MYYRSQVGEHVPVERLLNENWVNVRPCCVAQMDANASFLRAARAGALDKVLECLDENGADINACNAVRFIVAVKY